MDDTSIAPAKELADYLLTLAAIVGSTPELAPMLRVAIDRGQFQLTAYAPRAEVCERVVVGTETVTKAVPDPVALAAVPTVEVTELVERVEWKCRPLLASETVSAGTRVTS